MKRWLLALLMLAVAPAWALKEARLLKQSTSGQTALFNLGSLDGVEERDFAVIVKQIRNVNTRDLRVIPVARARNIKMNTDSSVWMLYRIFDPELLVKGDKFLILSESEMLSGRRDPRFGRLTVVDKGNRPVQTAKAALTEDHERIVKLNDKYEAGDILHEKKTITNSDGTLIDLEEWEKIKGERYRVALYKSPNQKDFRRKLRLATFEKLVTGYLQKVNDPDFNYDAFYEEQMRENYSNDFRKNSNFETEYRTFVSNQQQKISENDKLRRELLEKGETWSEDYSDEELKQNLEGVSILQEKSRREYLVAKPPRYSLFLDYSFNMTDAQSGQDVYRRDSRTGIELGLEATPFLKHETLERFTLFASVRRNNTALSTGGFNADVNDTSLSFGANWYPLYAPYAVEAPVFFLGAFVRTGYANVSAPTTSDVGKYTVLSVPGLWGGMKYLLRSGLGLRILASMETLTLDRYEVSRTGSVLPDSTRVAEVKTGVGLTYGF